MPGQAHGGAAFATAETAEGSAKLAAADGSNGVLVGENGEKFTGEYTGGDLYVLAYFAQADTTYLQYLTAEEEVEPTPESKSSGSDGCDVGLSLGLGALALAAVPLVRRKK